MLIPRDNEKDLADIPDNVKKGLKIIPVTSVDEVLSNALTKELVPIEWSEEDERKADVAARAKSDDEDLGVVTH